MLRRRLLDALDSSMPLLFVEGLKGAGKHTLLSQWAGAAGRAERSELRFLFRAQQVPDDTAALVRQFWSVLRRRRDLDLPALPDSDQEVADAARRHLDQARRPIAVAVVGAEHLSPEVFANILKLLEVGIRLIIAGVDVSHLAGTLTRGTYFSTLSDHDLSFTLEETRQFMAHQGADADDDAVSSMFRATLGHPGMISACLATLPLEAATAALTRDRAIGAYLADVPLEDWPSRFARFLGTAAHLPRFTAREAMLITQSEEAPHFMERCRALGVGRMVWHPGLQERVFRWDEPARRVLLQFLMRDEVRSAEDLERVVEAARDCGDDALLISTLIYAGHLDQAEDVLRDRIWDIIPNAKAPLWAPLERVSPLQLVGRPALLSARLRLSPHRTQSPVSVRAALTAGRKVTEAAEAGAPWTRVGNLACAIEFALYAGQRERLVALFTRARTLIADLVASEAGEAATGREVCDLLLIADAAFRSGNTIPAAEIGRLADQLMEVDPVRLDPRGERLAYARRLILHDHRARGLEDSYDPRSLLAGIQFLWRDGDVVVAAMSLMWRDLDDGDFGAADSHLQVAASLIADPEAWPILMMMRAHLAVLRKSPGEVEAFISAYERSTLSEPGPFAQQSLSQMSRITDYLSAKVGRPVASPGYLPATPEPGRLFYPRVEFTVRISEALYAVRADNTTAARAHLAQAVALSPRRELGLYTLANASEAEVRALIEVARVVPGGTRLRLERALRFAGALHRPQIDLSEREQEVLAHLRGGATNTEMAQEMFVSVNTVKFHRANLMRKLDANSRDQVLTAAGKLGL